MENKWISFKEYNYLKDWYTRKAIEVFSQKEFRKSLIGLNIVTGTPEFENKLYKAFMKFYFSLINEYYD